MSYLNVKDLSGPIASGHGWSTFVVVNSDSEAAAVEKARDLAPDAEHSVGRIGRFGGAILSGYNVTARSTVWLDSPKYTASREWTSDGERHFIVDRDGNEVAKISCTGISGRNIAWRMAYDMNIGVVA